MFPLLYVTRLPNFNPYLPFCENIFQKVDFLDICASVASYIINERVHNYVLPKNEKVT